MSISDVIVVIEKNAICRCDEEYSEKKNHQNPSTNKKSAPGKPPNLKDVNIPRVN